jgi:type IV secretory pathway VirJ component
VKKTGFFIVTVILFNVSATGSIACKPGDLTCPPNPQYYLSVETGLFEKISHYTGSYYLQLKGNLSTVPADSRQVLKNNNDPASDGTGTLKESSEQVKDLPLRITDFKFQDHKAPVALIISGDGGWYGFEQSIADHLAGLGIPTIGLDSRRYFWKRKTPEETAADISTALSYYGAKWEREQFILIGYSLGAEIVPFILTRLPEEMRAKIRSSVLLSPAINTDFEIHVSNMLGMGNRENTFNVVEEIAKIQAGSLLAIFGESEKSKVPGLLTGTPVKIRIVPGDHHYRFDLPLLIRVMRENMVF